MEKIDQKTAIGRIKDALANKSAAKSKKILFVIGAGVSVSAGIPTADGIVAEIKKRFLSYKPKEGDDYQAWMANVPKKISSDFFKEYIKEAKINWGHIALANMVLEKKVDRILTLNFDNLFLRASGLFDELPSIYDYGSSLKFNSSAVSDPSIHFLHGQFNGFVQIHNYKNNEEDDRHKLLRDIWLDSIKDRIVVVIGYSGKNDPFFKIIKDNSNYQYGLFWVSHGQDAPSELETMDNVSWCPDQIADEFLYRLSYELGCPEPVIMKDPLKHLNNKFSEIVDRFPLSDELGCPEPEIMKDPLNHLNNKFSEIVDRFPLRDKGNNSYDPLSSAKERLEKLAEYDNDLVSNAPIEQNIDAGEISPKSAKSSIVNLINKKSTALMLMVGKYDKLVKYYEENSQSKSWQDSEITDVAWAYVMLGIDSSVLAKSKSGQEADDLFHHAFDKFQKALVIKPKFHEALNNWGLVLEDLAKTKSGQEADDLYHQAFDKYQQAFVIKPDYYKALNNWGVALYESAKTKSGQEADKLYHQAIEKYQQALVIKPDYYEALYNWGNALWKLAMTKQDHEKSSLFNQAEEKFYEANKIKPHIADYNLACLMALKKDEENAQKYLLSSQSENVDWPGIEHLKHDEDFAAYRDRDWFKKLVE